VSPVLAEALAFGFVDEILVKASPSAENEQCRPGSMLEGGYRDGTKAMIFVKQP
jgi:hypothetical protein